MNKNESENERPEDSIPHLQENLIGALLQAAYQTESDSQREQRCIGKVLQSIGAESEGTSIEDSPSLADSNSVTNLDRSATDSVRSWGRWKSVAIAASALLAIGIAFQLSGGSGSGKALAAVERSLAAAKEIVARHYRITVTKEGSEKSRTFEGDLYVEGVEQFALRVPGLIPGSNVWMGSDGKEAWFVPAIGPVRVGDETGLGKWLSSREQLSTPTLEFETILTRLKNDYDLKQETDETLTLGDGSEVVCLHVAGLRRPQIEAPAADKVDLWCDKSTGVVIRLASITESQEENSTTTRALMDFVGTPDLSDDWFTPKGHYRGFRRKLRFDSAE